VLPYYSPSSERLDNTCLTKDEIKLPIFVLKINRILLNIINWMNKLLLGKLIPLSWSRESMPFIKSESSLPYSQEPTA
jgi:hypothetical protein